MAEAWELIGSSFVPSDAQKRRTHDAIEATLKSILQPNLYHIDEIDNPNDIYEVWPQKLAADTFELMQRHSLTRLPLPNGDYPFTPEGGLLVMSKLADACAGTRFARVTDRLMAYGLIGSGSQRRATAAEVVPITLDLIDASSIPLKNLITLRKKEASERGGSDYTKLRHNYADVVQNHISELSSAVDPFEREELNRQFRDRMKSDLRDLRRELGGNKIDLVLKPILVAGIVAGGTLATGGTAPVALAAGAVAAAGSSMNDVAKTVADFFSSHLNFNRKQKETMTKHPMSYMYALSSIR